jgi:hypothetical protein
MKVKNIVNEVVTAIKQKYTDIDWDKFEDMDRALNWELWHGPLPSNYWKDSDDGEAVEPLEHYDWQGWIQAQTDIQEILDPIPQTLYFDSDSNTITETNPDDDENNWDYIKDSDGNITESIWIGGESWIEVNPREYLMYVETFKQVF